MKEAVETFLKPYLKKDLPDIRPGDTVRVYQIIKEISSKGKSRGEERQRIQVFEGVVLARKHGRGITSTITVRKVINGVGVERIFPLHSPNIEKIEIVSRAKVRRAKLYYLRKRVGKKAKLRRKELKGAVVEEEKVTEEKIEEEKKEEKEVEKKKEETKEKTESEEIKQEQKEEKEEKKEN